MGTVELQDNSRTFGESDGSNQGMLIRRCSTVAAVHSVESIMISRSPSSIPEYHVNFELLDMFVYVGIQTFGERFVVD